MEAHDMSNCNCNSLSCRHGDTWHTNGHRHGCSCGSNSCGCVLSDGTPACNPWAPWGQISGDTTCGCRHCNTCGHWGGCGCNTCGAIASDAACSICGNAPCTCNPSGTWWNSGCDCAAGNAGYLVPRYTSIGRAFQRRITQTLCIDDIPDCAEAPLTLVAVTVSGQATWEQLTECRQQLLRVNVPVVVQIRDCTGRCRTGHATVMLTIPLCGNCVQQDLWRGQLYVAPCIRLAAPVTANEDSCFDATLEVQAEVYLVRLQAISG